MSCDDEEYYVKPCKFTCAKDFLDSLDETNELWRGETWLFRGQNVDKPLLPTAMRPCKVIDDIVNRYHARFSQAATSVPELIETIAEEFEQKFESFREDERYSRLIQKTLQFNEHQISRAQAETGLEQRFFSIFRRNYVSSVLHKTAERLVVVAFVELSDQTGLTVPRDSFVTLWDKPFPFHDQITKFNSLDTSRQRDIIRDITDEYASIAFALARHHTVPTRLLDCTYRPLVAAFFSAYAEGEADDKSDRCIVVWAIHQNSLPRTDLRVVKHRRNEIGFLQAQDGAFIYDKMADDKYLYAGEWLPLEFDLQQLVESGNVFKFILPYSEREKLLDLLLLKGISKPVLMPSFDNVAKEIQNERFDLVRFVENKV